MNMGKVLLTLRFSDNCRRKKCGHECYVIDTYIGPKHQFIGNWFIHEIVKEAEGR